MRVSGQYYVSAALYLQGRTSGTHWIGGWVSRRAGVDTEARGNFFMEDRTPVVQSVVRHLLTELPHFVVCVLTKEVVHESCE
jgi:hypothetical protein